MAMKLVKQDRRIQHLPSAATSATRSRTPSKNPVNGEEKVRILVDEGLIKAAAIPPRGSRGPG